MNINKSDNIGIKISLFSSEQVKNFSYGKIYNSKTLNYKNLKPEIGGLFCDRAFGSSNNFCYCEKSFSYDDHNFICNYCGVETSIKGDNFKRKRMGHIELADFFINPLYYKTPPYYLSIITGLTQKHIKNILYDDHYFVFYTLLDFININQILTNNEYFFLKEKYPDKIYALTGLDWIKFFLKNFNLSNEIKNIKKFFNKNSYNLNKNFLKKKYKKYNTLKSFFYNNLNISNILIKNLIVLPPDLRPIVRLPNETVVSSDLNELYKEIINSNIRLKKIKFFFGVPFKIISDENKLLQNNINNLFIGNDNKEKKFKSLIDNLKGKKGFFRNNLLGKRVDYSGRGVIVSGANLKMGECAIPKSIIMELFRPFIYNKILKNPNFNIKFAKNEVDKMSDFSYSVLLSFIKNYYVLLNRAPTLHKLGLQAFKILITEDKAIKLHPLVCQAFNADFDGDQMAVHIPISVKSNLEFKKLIYTKNNILYPANGTCCIAPTKDIIFGIHYATKINFFDSNNKIFIFNNLEEVLTAFNYNFIDFNTIIFFRIKELNFFNSNLIYKIYKTTLSRIIIFSVFPNNFSFNFLNKVLGKKEINKILNLFIYIYDSDFISNLCDNLMRIGFNFSTHFGLSISTDDMVFDFNKKKILNHSNKVFISYYLNYLNFLLTKNSKRRKILNLWDLTCNLISSNIIFNFNFSNYLDFNNIFLKSESLNSLYIMMTSGARGSESQIKQICSNRGLINYKKMGVFEIPVLNSLREGMNILEYFYFAHGSRKTLADTALKTSSAGYLTRKLVEVSNNIFISNYDCETKEGLMFKSLIHQGEVVEDLFERIFGRVLLSNIISYNKRIFIKKNTLIDNNVVNLLKKLNIDNLIVRTPLKCVSKLGICCLCYGLDLSKGRLVNIGEMVGVVAAQSIGEPGTQLTMRTFHTGGVFNKLVRKSFYNSNSNGFLKYSLSLKYVTNKNNFKIVVSKFSKLKIVNVLGKELETFSVPYSSYLFFENNDFVKKGDMVCKWESNFDLIISEYQGFLKFNNFVENFNFIKRYDVDFYEITSHNLNPSIHIYNKNNVFVKEYLLKVGDLINLKNNNPVDIGDILIKTPLDIDKAEDIIGGLPKINNLFEARVPLNKAFLSPLDGFVKLESINKKKIIFKILDFNDNVLFSMIFSDKKILISNNQKINKGDVVTHGEINPHDILFLYGVDGFVNFFLEEVKYIYSSQGVKIDDKHLEIIISEMLKSVIITDPGTSNFLIGEIVLLEDVENFNNSSYSLKKILYDIVLTGITNQSLRNNSFLSAASFQKTSFILSSAGMNSRIDDMTTLKNVVMIGDLFIAGSGSYNKLIKL